MINAPILYFFWVHIGLWCKKATQPLNQLMEKAWCWSNISLSTFPTTAPTIMGSRVLIPSLFFATKSSLLRRPFVRILPHDSTILTFHNVHIIQPKIMYSPTIYNRSGGNSWVNNTFWFSLSLKFLWPAPKCTRVDFKILYPHRYKMQKEKPVYGSYRHPKFFQLFFPGGTLLCLQEYNYKKGKNNLSANKGTPKIMVTMAPLASKVGRDLVDLLSRSFLLYFQKSYWRYLAIILVIIRIWLVFAYLFLSILDCSCN